VTLPKGIFCTSGFAATAKVCAKDEFLVACDRPPFRCAPQGTLTTPTMPTLLDSDRPTVEIDDGFA
jgi:hypothetical protein